MRTQVYYYSFNSKQKPGSIVAHGIRFESLDVKASGFDETTFKILCDQHDELISVPIGDFAKAVTHNFNQSPFRLKSIDSAPKDGRYVLLFGPSGHTGTPLRCQVCRYDAEYRPRQPWVNHSNDSFMDGGEEPTHWMELPTL